MAFRSSWNHFEIQKTPSPPLKEYFLQDFKEKENMLRIRHRIY
jgi:hypothetical protein